jgi:diguanylate cyclase (GGDEF)-like protein
VKGTPVRDENGAILGWVGVHTDITERWESVSRIEYLATHDALTRLPNRLLFDDRLGHLLQQRGERKHAVLFMDLNRFKIINDSLGHDVGDRLLAEVAFRLRSKLRAGDTVARFGGDEFVFLFEDIQNQADVARLARKILAVVAEPVNVLGHELTITGSIGASLYPRDGTTPSVLLRHADQAMYRAKAMGGNDIQFFDQTHDTDLIERFALEGDLRRAVERKELVLHYQPKMHVSQNRVFCLEALVRWNHPKRGMVPPVEFIPIAEEVGLISQIGEWVLEEACRQLNTWKKQGLQNVTVSVNLSGHQLSTPDFMKNLKKILKRTGIDPHALELEITETALMENIRSYHSLLEEIRSLGIRMAIDDFGTGYSSLSYLKKLPIQTLKIDRSFIRDVVNNKDDAAIVCATISMAQRMGLNIIAEGVETKEHMDFLLQNGCELMQGFYFSCPLAPAQVEEFLLKHLADQDHLAT